MSASRYEAIALGKRLKRTLGSAPDPHVPARALHATLASGKGWTKGEQQAIDALGAWLDTRPSTDALRARCDQVLRLLAGEPERRRR